ncbi:MAG: dTMP kinase [Mariprofundales bacterium]|nr:dTMP kinase [Mariprofundales bacterium]
MQRFITFEGADGCGKSTQIALTADWLRGLGHRVTTTHEPGDNSIGKEIRRLLLDPKHAPTPTCELLLFLADRAQHVTEIIRPALADSQWVLCDRFTDSTVVYQLAARKLAAISTLQPLLEFAQQATIPASTLWFDLPLETALQRIAERNGSSNESRMDRESRAFHQAVHQGFATLYRQHPQRIQRIDAHATIAQVQQQVQQTVQAMLH